MSDPLLENLDSIQENEKWLYENPQTLSSVQQGLNDSAAGNVESLGSFASFIQE